MPWRGWPDSVFGGCWADGREAAVVGTANHQYKDREMFGAAPYAEPGEPPANPVWEKRYVGFVAESYRSLTCGRPSADCAGALDRDYVVCVPDFISPQGAADLEHDIPQFPPGWWSHATLPGPSGWKPVYLRVGDSAVPQCVQLAERAAADGHFAYHFKRTLGAESHYKTCWCYACRMTATFSSIEVLAALSRIVGRRVTGLAETFCSLYETGHFLTKHHDKAKGDYAFALALSRDWNPAWGGLTHFCDTETGDIYKTVSPRFGMLTIFKLDHTRWTTSSRGSAVQTVREASALPIRDGSTRNP